MHTDILKFLKCPVSGSNLTLKEANLSATGRVVSGKLINETVNLVSRAYTNFKL